MLIAMDGAVEVVIRRDRREEVSVWGRPGSVSFLAGVDRPYIVRITGQATIAAVHLSDDWFHRLCMDGAPEQFGSNSPLSPDPTIHSLTRTMQTEVEAGAVNGQLYGESLSMALLSYIMQRIQISKHCVRGRLSVAQCNMLRDYILEHLGQNISLMDLAKLLEVSPRHFTSLFRKAFGTTPHRYLLEQRLAHGAELLVGSDRNIAEVALAVGFCNQSHFTAAFHRIFGVTPGRYVTTNGKDGRRI